MQSILNRYAALDAYIDEHLDGWLGELVELCAIPSETGQADALDRAADWTARRLKRLGASVDVLRLPAVPSLVVAQVGPHDCRGCVLLPRTRRVAAPLRRCIH